MKRTKANQPKETKNISSYIICIGFLALLPLVIKENHFELTQLKANVFLIVGAVFLCSFIIELLLKKIHISLNIPTALILLFLLTVIISSSEKTQSFKDALLGNNGWRIGLLAITLFVIIFIYTSNNNLTKRVFTDTLIITNLFVFFIGIIECSNLFIGELYYYIEHRLYFSYISTIGNTNWMVGYLSLTLPVLYILYLKENSPGYKISILTVLAMGLLNCIIASSDGIYLAFGFMAIFTVPHIFKKNSYVKDTAKLIFVFSLLLFVFNYSTLFSEKILYLDGISAVILKPYITLPMTVISLAALLFYSKNTDKTSSKLNRAFIITILTALSCCFLYLFCNLYTAAKNFDFSWGNNRGWVWQYSKIAFEGFSPFQKLFGYGPENLTGWYYDLSQQLNANYTVAHSEPIQVLLSFGISGFISWLSCWIYILISFYKTDKKEESITYFLPLTAYFAQSFVNTATTVNIAILAVVAGLYIYSLKKIS